MRTRKEPTGQIGRRKDQEVCQITLDILNFVTAVNSSQDIAFTQDEDPEVLGQGHMAGQHGQQL